MDKKLASAIVQAHNETCNGLDKIAHLIDTIPDANEKTRFRRAIAELMGDMYIKLLRPIIQEHDDLDPERGEGLRK